MGLRLKNSSGNYVELNAPSSIATNFGLTLPVNDGNASQYLSTDGAGVLSWQTVNTSNLTRLTAVTPTGSSVDYTSLPSGIRKLYVVMNELSADGTGKVMVQLGDSGGLETTGYTSASIVHYTTAGAMAEERRSDSFNVFNDSGAYRHNVIMLIANITGNKWVSSHNGFLSDNASYPYNICHGGGRKELSGELTQIRITLSTGNFDNGDVNLFYEV